MKNEEKTTVDFNGDLGTAFRLLEQHEEKLKTRQETILSLQQEEIQDLKNIEQLESKLQELKNQITKNPSTK